jgi:DNA-binding LytR/AlgR family response regulator
MAATPSRPTEHDWLFLPEAPRLHLRHSDIPIIRAAGNYCEFDVLGQPILVRVTATQLAERLKPHGFVRVSRGAIVNLARVRRVRPVACRRLTLLLDNGSEIAVSRSHRIPFERHLAIWTSRAN